MKEVHGMYFPDADQFMANELKRDGTYQFTHLRDAMNYVTDHSVALDGGAHVGTWSRALSAVFGKVIAFEPSPDTFEALQANMREHGCTNVELHQAALGATAGTVDLILDGRALTLQNTGARYVTAGNSIDLITIDSLNLPHLGFLKLDVEGSELAAMQGAKETLKRCRPVILFEDKKFWTRFGHAKDAPHQFLKTLGYRHLLRSGCDEIWGWVQ